MGSSRRVETTFTTRYEGQGAKQLKRDTQDVGQAAEKTGRQSQRAASGTGSLFQTVAKFAAGGAAIMAARQLMTFGMQSVRTASDIGEMESKFNTVFGDQAGSVTDQLGQFADAANRSVFDLKGFAATLQDTFVPLGYAREEAAGMSVELVKLAEDLASFNNMRTGDVVRDLQSALVGNTETLRKYGVVASQVAIEQYALENGVWDGVDAITAQEKASAILGITLASTTDAQGDAIRTADGFANKSRGLEAAVKDLQKALGETLLPTANETVDVLGHLARGATAAVDALGGAAERRLMDTADAALSSKNQIADLVDYARSVQNEKSFLTGLLGANDELDAIFVQTITRIAQASRSQREFNAAVEEFFGPDAVQNNAMAAGIYERAIADARDAVMDYGSELDRLRRLTEDVSDTTGRATRHTDTYTGQMDALRRAGAEAAGVQQWFNEVQARSGQVVENNSEIYARNRERLAEATDLIRGYFLDALQKVNTEQALFVERGGEVVVNSQAVGDAIQAAGVAAGLTAAELTLISDRFLELPAAQQEAILKSIIFETRLEGLKEQLKNGEINALDFRNAALEMAENVNNMNFDEARGELGGLEEDLTGLVNRDWSIHVNVTVDQLPDGNIAVSGGGAPGGGGTTYTRQHGGPAVAGRPLIVGETGWEMFIPEANGQIYNQNQIRGMMGGQQTINIYLANPAGASAAAIATQAANKFGQMMKG